MLVWLLGLRGDIQLYRIKLFFLFFFLTFSSFGFTNSKNSPFYPNRKKQYERGIFLAPLGSFILPGFDQYWEHQNNWGLLYSSFALTGAGIELGQEEKNYLTDEEDEARGFNYHSLGGTLYMASGSFSAFHSFRTAVNTRKEDFPFLKEDEHPKDLVLAPFNFSYLKRPSTYVPLLLGAGLMLYSSLTEEKDRYHKISEGAFFTGGFSFLAGVHEEALFRGWLLPINHYYSNSAFWGNIWTSILFGAVHFSRTNKFPLFQALAGYYLGHLTQKNNYSLKESIFLHTWWDVLAIGTFLLVRKNGKDLKLYKNVLNFTF